jgi:hypothetical protein
MPSETSFEIVFSKMEEIIRDDANGEFQVSFGEAAVEEQRSIDELRRLAANVAADTTTTFMTS